MIHLKRRIKNNFWLNFEMATPLVVSPNYLYASFIYYSRIIGYLAVEELGVLP